MSEGAYEVVSPSGRRAHDGLTLAKRLDTLDGKVVAELWDWVFKGDQMFETWEREFAKTHPTTRFVSWREFGEIHGANEHQVLAELPRKFQEMGVDAVICGVGC
jgi:hypothetical protein